MPDWLVVFPGHKVEAVALVEPSEPENSRYPLHLLRNKWPDLPSSGVRRHHGSVTQMPYRCNASQYPLARFGAARRLSSRIPSFFSGS
jgi:hypothetical protein